MRKALAVSDRHEREARREDPALLEQMSPAERERFVRAWAAVLLASVLDDIERDAHTVDAAPGERRG